MANPAVQTAAAHEPVTLNELKRQIRINIDDTSEDFDLAAKIRAARVIAETFLGFKLNQQTLDYTLDRFAPVNYIELPEAAPLQSITQLDYTDSAGATVTWAATNYFANTTRSPGRLVLNDGVSWPSVTLQPRAGVMVRYVVGYATGDLVPEPIRLGILKLAGNLYIYRKATAIPEEEAETHLNLWRPYRLHSFGAQRETLVA